MQDTFIHRSSTYNITVNGTTYRVNTVGIGVFGIPVGGFEVVATHNVEMEDYFALRND